MLLAFCCALCPLSFLHGALEMGARIDGPGIGLLPGMGLSLGVASWAFLPAFVATRLAWRLVPGRGQRRIALAIAALACVAFLRLDCERRLYAASWNLRCDGGEPRACYAAADAYRYGLGLRRDPARAAQRYRRACDGGVAIACRRLSEVDQ